MHGGVPAQRSCGMGHQVSPGMDNEVSVQGVERRGGRARPRSDPADLPGKGSNHHTRSGITRPHTHAGVFAGAPCAGEAGAVHKGAVVAQTAGGVPAPAEETLGRNTCGHVDTFARRWARSTRRRSRRISRIRSGTRTITDSRSPRPPSLEPALSRDELQAASAAPPTFSRNSTHRLLGGGYLVLSLMFCKR